jgi:hypothetical protein
MIARRTTVGTSRNSVCSYITVLSDGLYNRISFLQLTTCQCQEVVVVVANAQLAAINVLYKNTSLLNELSSTLRRKGTRAVGSRNVNYFDTRKKCWNNLRFSSNRKLTQTHQN